MFQDGGHATVISFLLNLRPGVIGGSGIFRLDSNEAQISAGTLKAARTSMGRASRRNYKKRTVPPKAELSERAGQSGKSRFGGAPVSQRIKGWHIELSGILYTGMVADDADNISHVSQAAVFPPGNQRYF